MNSVVLYIDDEQMKNLDRFSHAGLAMYCSLIEIEGEEDIKNIICGKYIYEDNYYITLKHPLGVKIDVIIEDEDVWKTIEENKYFVTDVSFIDCIDDTEYSIAYCNIYKIE
jgi:hypothetical protein